MKLIMENWNIFLRERLDDWNTSGLKQYDVKIKWVERYEKWAYTIYVKDLKGNKTLGWVFLNGARDENPEYDDMDRDEALEKAVKNYKKKRFL